MRHRTNALKWLGVSAKSLVAIGLMSAMAVQAEEVTPEQAQTAVRNWIRKNPCPMTAQFATGDGEAKTYFMDGRALFHVVQLEGGGFVITSGDTKLPPVIAFSGTGSLDLSDEGNPLNALLKSDLGQRTAAIGRTTTANAKRQMLSASVAGTSESESTFEEQWAELLVDADSNSKESSAGLRLMSSPPDSISDVRVAPLVQSKWDQGQWNGENTFNRFIPNNYNCGCVATATAQIMRYWQMPKSSVAPGTYQCWVNHEPSMLTMKGGKYDWENMPLTADRCTTDTQRNAIGTLLYDVGIALQMDWYATENGSLGNTAGCMCDPILRNRFGYASARTYVAWNGRQGLEGNVSLHTGFRNALLASLDAGMPVVIALLGEGGGHALVVDGYGFNGESLIYCHLNLGWSGFQDAWYNFISDGMTDLNFNYMDHITYNIHPSVTGDVISGRVVDQSGAPVSGATVTLVSSSGVRQTTTSQAKGIYSFHAEGGNYKVFAESAGNSSEEFFVELPAGQSADCTKTAANERPNVLGGSKLGNLWGVDLVLVAKPDLCFVKPDGWPKSVFLWSSAAAETSSFMVNEAIYLYNNFGNKGTSAIKTDYKILHEVLDASGNVISSVPCDCTASLWLAAGESRLWGGVTFAIPQNLSAGRYTYRCTLDSGNAIAESDESNNVVTINFTVTVPAKYTLTINPNGGVLVGSNFGQQEGTGQQTSVEVTYGTLYYWTLGTATKTGAVFDGWWTSATGGEQVYDLEGNASIGSSYWDDSYRWRYKGNVAVYAHWTYKVTFGKNGGTGGDNYVTATYGSAMPTPRNAPTQSGWTFGGYWDTLAMDEKGNPKGKQYYDANMKSVRSWDKASTATLWAKWTNKVTFGKNGGTGGDNYVTCTKGQPMPKRTMPTKSGYVFDGYWTTTGAGGVKYYNADGTSAHTWDKSGSVTLWAKWVKPVACKVTFGKNGGTGGDDYVTATTGKAMPTPRTAPKRTGWTFGGYWDTLACDASGNPLGKQYYDASMKSVRAWDKTAAATLWAKWTVRVKLGKNGGTGGDDYVTVIFNQPFPKRAMPKKSGYAFGGYFVSASSKTGQCYNPDGTGTASMKWSTGGTPTIWALWTKTSSCVEVTPADTAAPNASAAPAAAELAAIPAGLYSGVLADGSGAFWLMLDEPEDDYERTAYLYVASEDGVFTAECTAEEAGGALLLTTEDGTVYAFDPVAGTLVPVN